jgi:hypothetical protein
MYPAQGIAVVGTDNIDVGKKTSTRKSSPPIVKRLFGSGGLPQLRIDNQNPSQDLSRPNRPKISGAMTQQCGDSGRGNQSTPQKLVHLVGCREPKDPGVKARTERPIRPGPPKP